MNSDLQLSYNAHKLPWAIWTCSICFSSHEFSTSFLKLCFWRFGSKVSSNRLEKPMKNATSLAKLHNTPQFHLVTTLLRCWRWRWRRRWGGHGGLRLSSWSRCFAWLLGESLSCAVAGFSLSTFAGGRSLCGAGWAGDARIQGAIHPLQLVLDFQGELKKNRTYDDDDYY